MATYSEHDLQPLDPFEGVRRRPEMYAPADKSSAEAFARTILEDSVLLGARNARIVQSENWVAVCSDTDWLGDTVATLFTRLEPFPEAGVNSIRAESIAKAYCRAMCYRRPGGDLTWVKAPEPGAAAPDAMLTLPPAFLAFTLI